MIASDAAHDIRAEPTGMNARDALKFTEAILLIDFGGRRCAPPPNRCAMPAYPAVDMLALFCRNRGSAPGD
jgi:hypothetical protein